MRVQGTGPFSATLVVIWERPITHAIGAILARILHQHGLPPGDELFLTYLVREPAAPVTPERIAQDRPELDMELAMLQPQVVVTIGPVVTYAFLGNAVPLNMSHGLPHQIPQCVVFPCMNPLYASENTVAYDFSRLALYLKGQLGVRPKDQHPASQYVLDTHTLLYPGEPLALVTEGPVEDPWCVAYSQHPGIGHVIRPPFPSRAQDILDEYEGPILLHDALHHLPILRAMHIRLPHLADTKVMAFLLGEPLDLETLAYRYCGMLMTPCDPRTTPHPETAIRYLGRQADALLRLYPLLEAQIVARGLEDTLTRDLAVLLKIDLMHQAGEFTDLGQFAFLSSSVWPNPK